MNVDELVAIDIHTHAEVSVRMAPDRWLEDFARLPIKAEVRPLIMKENAVKLLKLKGGA